MIVRLIFVVVAAFLWAKLEVEIEGKHGWAMNLPTWRIENHVLLKWFMNGRPLTGFHTWSFTFVFFIFHFPLLWPLRCTVPMECEILGSVLLFWVLEDFFWFIVNPHYGWHRYNPKEISWHRNWLWGLPTDHWALLFIGFLLLAVSYFKTT